MADPIDCTAVEVAVCPELDLGAESTISGISLDVTAQACLPYSAPYSDLVCAYNDLAAKHNRLAAISCFTANKSLLEIMKANIQALQIALVAIQKKIADDSLIGPQGIQGIQGAQGIQGIEGESPDLSGCSYTRDTIETVTPDIEIFNLTYASTTSANIAVSVAGLSPPADAIGVWLRGRIVITDYVVNGESSPQSSGYILIDGNCYAAFAGQSWIGSAWPSTPGIVGEMRGFSDSGLVFVPITPTSTINVTNSVILSAGVHPTPGVTADQARMQLLVCAWVRREVLPINCI